MTYRDRIYQSHIIEHLLNAVSEKLRVDKLQLKFKRYQLYKFIYKWRKELSISENMFTDDPEFPYSPDIEDELNSLFDSGFLEYVDVNNDIFVWHKTDYCSSIPDSIVDDFKANFIYVGAKK